ncbi:hypothetical protein E4U60_001684 [Claviceps pazoutovae]|uniref:Stc1 domain-containing protein n=1 Tax=Claviceps pazoutovae TaxID=1649127 RepID=A0A9P7MJ88_9HYPO|nr:hypothetical protein E4U60_001684 [Claviceps pazoutovae]
MPRKRGNARVSQTSLPIRYRCKVGGEWKPIQAFSTTQQRLLERQISARGTVDAENSGMTCQEHSTGTLTELRCALCQLDKPYTDFSKTMRKSEDSVSFVCAALRTGMFEVELDSDNDVSRYQMCKRCTAWTETQEPGVVPAPLETGNVTHEEEEDIRQGTTPHMPDDFFPSDTLPQAPITPFAAMSIRGESSRASGSNKGSVTDTCSLPPHIIQAVMSSARSQQQSFSESDAEAEDNNDLRKINHARNERHSSSTSYISSRNESDSDDTVTSSRLMPVTEDLPPHLQALVRQISPGQGPSLGSSRGRSTFRRDTESISTATTMREGREEVAFNAWDGSGQRHDAVKLLTDPSTSSVCTSSTTNTTSRGEGRRDEPAARRKGGWHKAPRYRPGEETSN